MYCDCGERMWRVSALDLAFDYPPGSIEQRELATAAAIAQGIVWACYDCGSWKSAG